MKRLLFAGLLVLFGFICFVASPLVTAWFIRDAVINGNAQFLETQVDWTPVRATLKSSINKMMINPREPRRTGLSGLWAGIKSYFKRRLVRTTVDLYANPRGLPKLFRYARSARRNLTQFRDPDKKASLMQRVTNFWSRVKRAQFMSLTRFELDMADQFDARRFYCGVLEFRGFRWILTELHVRRVEDG